MHNFFCSGVVFVLPFNDRDVAIYASIIWFLCIFGIIANLLTIITVAKSTKLKLVKRCSKKKVILLYHLLVYFDKCGLKHIITQVELLAETVFSVRVQAQFRRGAGRKFFGGE